MALAGFYAVSQVRFAWAGANYDFKAGALEYAVLREAPDFTLINGKNGIDVLWYHVAFKIWLGNSAVAGVGVKGIADIINALDGNSAVEFYPKYKSDSGTDILTKYEVVLDQKKLTLATAKRAGLFDLYSSIDLITVDALTSLPDWLNF